MDPPIALPHRTNKPRQQGLTLVIDSGLPTGAFADAIKSAARHIDYVKFGWGTALATPQLEAKIALLEEHDIGFFFGGTLFEKFTAQGRFDEYLHYCRAHGCRAVEISNGTIALSNSNKQEFVARAADEFVVFGEVGYKDEARSRNLDGDRWIEFIAQDLAAGASYVITEARESGRSGICDTDGRLRVELVRQILRGCADTRQLIFEAPTKSLQTFFVTQLGANVNLANIPPSEVIATETLRLGLRSDTLLHFELDPYEAQELARA